MSSFPPPLGYSTPPQYPLPLSTNPSVDPSGVIRDEVPCRKCGYTLLGLPVDGRCPECGTPAGLSVMGDLLRYSDPRWVRTLQRGTTLIIAGIAVIVLGIILSIVLAVALGAPPWIVSAIAVVGSLLMLAGAWLLTEPDPSGIGEDRYGTSRKLIRVALIVGLGNTVLELIPQAVTLPPSARVALTVVGGVAGIIGLIGQFAQLNYLSKLASRIPDQALVERARFLMWAIGISYGVLIVFGIFMGLYLALGTGGQTRAGTGGVMMVGGCVMVVAGLALLVFGIMYLLMLDRLRVRFGQHADAAEATWARGNAPAAATPQ